jgi:hypothetical protein
MVIFTLTSAAPRYKMSSLPQQCNTFHDHVGNLPEWKREILEEIRWLRDFDSVMQTLHHLSPEISVLVVSDGSAHEGQHMSFGVTIGTSTGEKLVKLAGHATGFPSSHQAECTGCLAGALFFVELQTYTQTTWKDLTIQVIADNQGMIRSVY